MPRPRKNPKPARPVNLIFKEIQAKPPKEITTPKVQEKQNIEEQDQHRNGVSEEFLLGIVARDGTEDLSSGIVYNSVVKNPSEHGPARSGSAPFENDGSATYHGASLEGATPTAPYVPSTRPPESGTYAVSVEVGSRTEPLCAIFSSRADYSCMPATVAERLVNVNIRETTPAQRRRWYSTPAGQVYDPQRYAELGLKAFDPYIPTVKLTMLLLEGDGPIDGIHVYLGRPVFTKLAGLGIPLSVQEIFRQRTCFGAMNQARGESGNAEMSTLQSPAASAYNRGCDLSNTSQFVLPSSTINPGVLSLDSEFQGTMSPKTTPFSEASYCTSTISSFDRNFDSANSITEFMKNPADDVFVGYAGVDLTTHHQDLDSDTIDPVALSNSSQEFMKSLV